MLLLFNYLVSKSIVHTFHLQLQRSIHSSLAGRITIPVIFILAM